MRLIQYRTTDGTLAVGKVDADQQTVVRIPGYGSMYELGCAAIKEQRTLEVLVSRSLGVAESYEEIVRERRLCTPLAHPDPAHCLVSGTGLTHLGSAATRDAMHRKVNANETELTDSMRLFKIGLEGGRPQTGEPGAQPEWFYKGNGANVVEPGGSLNWPSFALDGGEEPELVGMYIIGQDGRPHRLGFALGNEFSDHVMERQNYLYLAHSKLRSCAIGPELRTGPLPTHLEGESRIRRGGTVVWRKPFLTGEANMSHSISNLEYHHFKYAAHRRPGDVHLHFFGTATLSCADGFKVASGDTFEIELKEFGAPLVNSVSISENDFAFGAVTAL
ncbi:MAG TPA: AraD1 family protein [Steroidobacteraceae bacterium]|nr:AraD1 family protein [Steroidobacteraceae bacterium]